MFLKTTFKSCSQKLAFHLHLRWDICVSIQKAEMRAHLLFWCSFHIDFLWKKNSSLAKTMLSFMETVVALTFVRLKKDTSARVAAATLTSLIVRGEGCATFSLQGRLLLDFHHPVHPKFSLRLFPLRHCTIAEGSLATPLAHEEWVLRRLLSRPVRNFDGEIREVSKLFIPPTPPTSIPYSPLLSAALGLVVESSELDRSIPDVPPMPCLERVSEWLVPVYPSSTPAYEMFSSKLTRCFSQLEHPYV